MKRFDLSDGSNSRNYLRAAVTFIGVFVFAFLVLTVCFVPILLAVALLALTAPVYLIVVPPAAIGCAIVATNLCYKRGGRIPGVAYVGYVLLIVTLTLLAVVRVRQLQDEARKLEVVKRQYGVLFYPGARVDPHFAPAIRADDSLTEVLRFYRENPACDGRKYYGGAGEYSLACRMSNSTSTYVTLSSRVDNNEPYVLITIGR